ADTGNIAFAGAVNLNTYDAANTGNVTLGASNGYSLTVGGTVSMLTSNPAYFSEASISADGGGTVDIGGSASLSGIRGIGRGGNVAISADAGSVNIGGLVTLGADGSYVDAASSNSN